MPTSCRGDIRKYEILWTDRHQVMAIVHMDLRSRSAKKDLIRIPVLEGKKNEEFNWTMNKYHHSCDTNIWCDNTNKIHISGVIFSVFFSSVVDHGFKVGSNIVIFCFSLKHVLLRNKSKDWLAGNQLISLSRVTCLPMDCCFSELALYKDPTI